MIKRCAFLLLILPPICAAGPTDRLREALTHHASFDHGFDADFSRGDPGLYVRKSVGKAIEDSPAVATEALKLAPTAGKFGGALAMEKGAPAQVFYRNEGVLDYLAASWSGTVSVWLRISPDEDLPPGYCDPIMVTGGDMKLGFMFLEWSPESPRRFRFAILPRRELWNPSGAGWEELPNERRPMIELPDPIFSRERWTHVVFTFDKINEGLGGGGRLYVDGRPRGAIENWDMQFGWDPAKVRLVVGRAYVGLIDDLAVFNRALDAEEIRTLHDLPEGAGSLRRP